jgi:hypothetical protein
MSRRFLNGLFGPDVPVWACELSPTQSVVVRASDNRRTLRSMASSPLRSGALVPGLKGTNVVESAVVRASLGRALEEARFFGSDIVLVVPDDAVRVALVDVESFPSGEEEQLAFVRWKFRKNVPFDVAAARVTWERIQTNGVVRLLAALVPQSVIRQYEEVVESFGIHAGKVVPSTLAALGLFPDSPGDRLFVLKTSTAVTTSILSGGQIRFYRKVPALSLYEAAYPTFVYYQDKLGGAGLEGVVVCGDADAEERAELEQGLGERAETLYASEIPDLFKPALGALQR